jgi:hypothetical protein
MREWNLGPGDPLALTLAADFRFCTPDYANDHIWELELGGGDPPALAFHTTYGLRARAMRIFPRFTLRGQSVTDPAAFAAPPHLRRFAPNFSLLDFSPLPGIEVNAEYWIPESHAAAGQITVTNRGEDPASLLLELCGQLAPLEGQGLAPIALQSANLLAGRTSDLAPVLFLTGGPEPGPGPYPSLTLDLALASGGSRTFTWVEAALGTAQESFDLARRIATRPWDAERTKIEMTNAAQTFEIQTGDPDWDAAFALAQKTAFGLFFGPGGNLPNPSFVLARQPDHGHSPHGDGRDYPPFWSGQPPLESYYLASLLPGASNLSAGLLKNFFAVQQEDGSIDFRPGLAGQRGRWLAAPLLAALAWHNYQETGNAVALVEAFPKLLAFHRQWFAIAHDRDGDGFPEWDHPLQVGLDDHPSFNVWHEWDEGADISTTESPALSALLSRETFILAKIAGMLKDEKQREDLELEAGALRIETENCWSAESVLYHYRDRDTHASPTGDQIIRQRGDGIWEAEETFTHPTRVLVQICFKDETQRKPEIILKGKDGRRSRTEHFERARFIWGSGMAVATSKSLFTALTSLDVRGVGRNDQVTVRVMDFSMEDVSLFLPLWAGIPDEHRARTLVARTLFAADRFGRPFGAPMCVSNAEVTPEAETVYQEVLMPWNHLIGEGLLAYGMRNEAAQLTARLMSAVIENLKRKRAFARAYHSESGAGLGERNPVHGLAPLGLFLHTLGVRIRSPRDVVLSGKNPFPWPVTVKYRGLTVTRQAEQTLVSFPNGQKLTLNDPTYAIVSAD